MSAPGIKSGHYGDLNPFDWTPLADGNLVCADCGSTVHPAYREQHDAWHFRIVVVEGQLRAIETLAERAVEEREQSGELEETRRALVAAQNFVNDAAPNAMTLAAVRDRIEGAAWLTKYQREFFLEALTGNTDE